MAHLDSERFGSAVDGLCEAALEPNLWPLALQELGAAAGGLGTILFYQEKSATGWYRCSPELDASLRAYFEEGWPARNTRTPLGIAALNAGVEVSSDATLFRSGELDRQPIQGEFFSRFGLRCFFRFELVPGRILASIERGSQGIADWELSIVQRALPLLRRAGHMALAMGSARSEITVDALSLVGCAAILLDHQGRVTRMNDRGERLYPSILKITNNYIAPIDGGAAKAFARLIGSAVAAKQSLVDHPVGPVMLPRPHGRPVIARAAPITGRDQDLFQMSKAILLLTDPDEEIVAATAELRQIFSLTEAEARVALLMAQGRDLGAIAIELGVAKETARSRLKSIFSKTNTHHQSELTALLGRIFPRTS